MDIGENLYPIFKHPMLLEHLFFYVVVLLQFMLDETFPCFVLCSTYTYHGNHIDIDVPPGLHLLEPLLWLFQLHSFAIVMPVPNLLYLLSLSAVV